MQFAESATPTFDWSHREIAGSLSNCAQMGATSVHFSQSMTSRGFPFESSMPNIGRVPEGLRGARALDLLY
jgi:hypothetical protein